MSQRKKQLVIAALLESSTITEAAKKAKLSRRTIERMLADKDFQRQLREARGLTFGLAMSRLCLLAGKAVDTLADALDGEEVAKTRFLSACRVLEFASQARNDDLQARLDEIEEQLRALAEID